MSEKAVVIESDLIAQAGLTTPVELNGTKMMYYFVSNLIHPVTLLFLIIVLVLIRLWWQRKVSRRSLSVLTVACLLWGLFSTPFVAYLSSKTLEGRFPRLETRQEPVDAIVVLAGGVQWPAPGDRVTWPSDGTLRRCFRSVELYRQGPACPIIVTGGVVNPSRPGDPEGAVLKRCLLEMGVPESDILVETRSRTTFENAVEAKRLLEERGYQKVLLVTDATHLLRSVRCFRKQGVEVVPAGTNYHSRVFEPVPFNFVPRAGPAYVNQQVFHEWLGLMWYWLKGRI